MRSILLITVLFLSFQNGLRQVILETDEGASTFTIKSMVVVPNPPQRSKKCTTTIVYVSSIPQPVSKVHIVTYLGSTKVDTRDVSNTVTMEADKEYTWEYSDTIPFIAPSGTYRVEYHFMDPAGAELGLIVNEFKL